ncbi:MAG: hypothetical protein RLZZ618_2437 [Pseudomonadota bacterium]|jgi:penicillin-binding protein 1A
MNDHPTQPPSRFAAWRTPLKRIGWVTLGVAGAVAASLAVYIGVLVKQAPSVGELKDARVAQPSKLVTADGQTLGFFQRDKQERVTLDKVSPFVIQALIATEDRRFRDHRGVDIRRTLSAVLHTATGDMQGGSTITQQLARNMFPEEIGRARSLHRKAKEMITALRIERVYTKDQILESYLNNVPFFYNVVGIEMAARTYYGVPAIELNELQSATLVGMLKGTQYYNPVRHPERALQRRNVVLSQMHKRGVLTPVKLRELSAQPLKVRLNEQPVVDAAAPHFASRARKWAADWADTHDYDLYADGLVIETTLDSRLQTAATRAVQAQGQLLQKVADTEWGQAALRVPGGGAASYTLVDRKAEPFGHFWRQNASLLQTFARDTPEFKKARDSGQSDADALEAVLTDTDVVSRLKRARSRLEVGFVAIEPLSGEVKAWVGSRDFEADQYDHVGQAERQPGSTFKPFVYGAALESGIGPERTYMDTPVEISLGAGGQTWKPTDMTGTSGLPITLRDGLIYSKNTITAQVMQEVGVNRTISLARALGVTESKLDPVPSLALGTSPVTLLEMVSAYASIAQLGTRHTPVYVKRILDREGRVIASFGAESSRAMSADSAVELIDMLRGVVQRGTGTQVKSRFGVSADVAGKTGTTQNNTDGWFILMHPNLVAGAWVGFNDTRVTMRSNYWGQGGHNAILIVGDFFRAALKEKLVDAKATFPPSRRPPPLPASAPLSDDVWSTDRPEDSAWREQREPINAVPVDESASAEDRANAPKTSAELDALLNLEAAGGRR